MGVEEIKVMTAKELKNKTGAALEYEVPDEYIGNEGQFWSKTPYSLLILMSNSRKIFRGEESMKAIRLEKRIEKDGSLEIKHLPIPEGEEVEIIILVKEEKIKKKYRPLDLYGAGKGIWKTVEEADRYIEEERASWED